MCPQRISKGCCDNLKLIFIVLKCCQYFFPLLVTTKHSNINWLKTLRQQSEDPLLNLGTLPASTHSAHDLFLFFSFDEFVLHIMLSHTWLYMACIPVYCVQSLINSKWCTFTLTTLNNFPGQCQIWSLMWGQMIVGVPRGPIPSHPAAFLTSINCHDIGNYKEQKEGSLGDYLLCICVLWWR